MQQGGAAGAKGSDFTHNLGAIDITRAFGDHIDDAGEGIGAIDGRAGTANDFNTSDVSHRKCAEGAAIPFKQPRLRDTIDQHQYMGISIRANTTDGIDG